MPCDVGQVANLPGQIGNLIRVPSVFHPWPACLPLHNVETMSRTLYPLVAVDVGNNRLKFGLFDRQNEVALPEPAAVRACDGSSSSLEDLAAWLDGRLPVGGRWWIASVNRPSTTRLLQWLQQARPADQVTLLAAGDLPLVVALERPDMVGIDRLLDAVAANRLRRADAAAVLVDVGTAITVDLVAADGSFQGGAILPGIAMSARALHTFTDLLPLVDMRELSAPPPALGTSTEAALQSGLFWGAVGAIRQLLEVLPGRCAGPSDVFLTGGAGPAVARLLGDTARHVPHLTLAGIALAAHWIRG
jgi:type III pantothenate kinase